MDSPIKAKVDSLSLSKFDPSSIEKFIRLALSGSEVRVAVLLVLLPFMFQVSLEQM